MVAGGLGDVASAMLSSRADKKNKNKTVTSQTVTSESSLTSSLAHPGTESTTAQPIRVLLAFKRNVFDPRKQMLQ